MALSAERKRNSLIIENIFMRHRDLMFEEFDRLHAQGISDGDVVTALDDCGHGEFSDPYLDWQGDGEPLSIEDDNTTTNPAVPDPGDAPSYAPIYALGKVEDKRSDEPDEDVCPFDCDSCHGVGCPCDRLGCEGSEAPGAK